MQSAYERTLLVFSILIFIFATREGWLHFCALLERVRSKQREHKLNLIEIASAAILMMVSAGPGGYYGLGLLGEFGII